MSSPPYNRGSRQSYSGSAGGAAHCSPTPYYQDPAELVYVDDQEDHALAYNDIYLPAYLDEEMLTSCAGHDYDFNLLQPHHPDHEMSHATMSEGYAPSTTSSRTTSRSGSTARPHVPFPRTSRTGARHFVTPARATPGFRCSFVIDPVNGHMCNAEPFNLPSEIRAHILDTHMTFSPFQCRNCKRVFTRLSLETRHLRQDDQVPGSPRHCPNSPVPDDSNFMARCDVRNALWNIHTAQHEVDTAVRLIAHYNGRLEERRRRVPAARSSRDRLATAEDQAHSLTLPPPHTLPVPRPVVPTQVGQQYDPYGQAADQWGGYVSPQQSYGQPSTPIMSTSPIMHHGGYGPPPGSRYISQPNSPPQGAYTSRRDW